MFNVYQKSFKEGFVVFVVLLHSSQLPDQKEGLLDSLHFKFFQISVEGGVGSSEINFSKIQNCLIYLRVKKLLDFFYNLGHFFYGSR